MPRRGRTMKRTRGEFPEALAEQMQKYGYTNKKLAEEIGIDSAAISKWKYGQAFPVKKNLRALKDILNIEIVPSTLTNEEAIKVNEVTSEQLKMSFTANNDPVAEGEPDEFELIKPKWTHIYTTNSSDSYRSAVMNKADLPERFRLIIVKQKLRERMDTIPFVALAIEEKNYEEEDEE